MIQINEANPKLQLDTSNQSRTQGGADSPQPKSLMIQLYWVGKGAFYMACASITGL